MKTIYDLARKRIIRKKRFYQHFTVFLGVMLFLFALNVLDFVTNHWHYVPGSGYSRLLRDILAYRFWWFPYPLLSWGFLVFIHYCFVFGIPFLGQFDEKWEAEAIQEEVSRLQKMANVAKPKTEHSMELKTLQKEMKMKNEQMDSEFL